MLENRVKAKQLLQMSIFRLSNANFSIESEISDNPFSKIPILELSPISSYCFEEMPAFPREVQFTCPRLLMWKTSNYLVGI